MTRLRSFLLYSTKAPLLAGLFVAGLLAQCAPTQMARAQDAPAPHTVLSIGRADLAIYKPDCNPLERRHDAWWVNQWGPTWPRVAFWGLYPAVGIAGARALTAIGVPRKVAAIGVATAFAFLPHARQAALGLKDGNRYRINLLDYAGDAWVRFAPVWDAAAHEHHSRAEYVQWGAGVLAFACVMDP